MNINDKREVRRLIKLAKQALKDGDKEKYTYAIAKSRKMCGETDKIELDYSVYDRAVKKLQDTIERTGVGKD